VSRVSARVRKAAEVVGELGAAGAVIAGCLVWGDDGRLQQLKLGPLAIWDRKRRDARRAARKVTRTTYADSAESSYGPPSDKEP
jgi:hypothetical protein